jgi:ATP-dependent Zn protease
VQKTIPTGQGGHAPRIIFTDELMPSAGSVASACPANDERKRCTLVEMDGFEANTG